MATGSKTGGAPPVPDGRPQRFGGIGFISLVTMVNSVMVRPKQGLVTEFNTNLASLRHCFLVPFVPGCFSRQSSTRHQVLHAVDTLKCLNGTAFSKKSQGEILRLLDACKEGFSMEEVIWDVIVEEAIKFMHTRRGGRTSPLKFDSEIERTLRANRVNKRLFPNMEGNNSQEVLQPPVGQNPPAQMEGTQIPPLVAPQVHNNNGNEGNNNNNMAGPPPVIPQPPLNRNNQGFNGVALQLSPQTSKWSGPYVITNVTNHGAIEIKDTKGGDPFKVNGQRLKPYIRMVDGRRTSIETMGLEDRCTREEKRAKVEKPRKTLKSLALHIRDDLQVKAWGDYPSYLPYPTQTSEYLPIINRQLAVHRNNTYLSVKGWEWFVNTTNDLCTSVVVLLWILFWFFIIRGDQSMLSPVRQPYYTKFKLDIQPTPQGFLIPMALIPICHTPRPGYGGNIRGWVTSYKYHNTFTYSTTSIDIQTDCITERVNVDVLKKEEELLVSLVTSGVITPYSMHYIRVATTPYSMRDASCHLLLTYLPPGMVANHHKWGLSVPYSGRRTVSRNLANYLGFNKPSDHGQRCDGETQTRASHRISHDPKDYAAPGVNNRDVFTSKEPLPFNITISI
ncbi:hypothetical protein LXL04_039936 [Taraxacum kok-saghyz]